MVKLNAASFRCAYIFFMLQVIVLVVPCKKTSNVNEFMMKNHRTRMRQNYIVQNTKNEVTGNNDENSIMPYLEEAEPENSPEKLPALIVDYANMIRNDIILLDNTVQTRTRKRGNARSGKDNQAVQEGPCSCEDDKTLLFLGEEYVPRTLEIRNCNENLCRFPYSCSSRSHNVTVLKRKYRDEVSQEDLPEDLQRKWVAVRKPVIVGCICSKDYLDVY